MPDKSLQELASRHGLNLEYPGDICKKSGKIDGFLAALKAIGLPINNAKEAKQLLNLERKKQYQQVLDPVLVREENEDPILITIRLPDNVEQEYQWTLTEESSTQHHGIFKKSDLPVEARIAINNTVYLSLCLNLEICLPCGYHQLTIRPSDQADDLQISSGQLIITPAQCYVPPGITGDGRIWGISVSLPGVRSRTNWGIGDYSDLKQILSWSAEQGAGSLHSSPLCSLSPSPTDVFNPYRPSCRALLNSLLIDVTSVPDFAECDEVRNSTHDAKFQARLAMLRDQKQVDYDGVEQVKGSVLKRLWQHFCTNHLAPETPRGKAFRRFQEEKGETLRYFGIFSAISELLHSEPQTNTDWSSWPSDMQNPRSKAVADFARHHKEEIDYHQFLQWQADMQLESIGRRSMELGLKVGILGESLFSSDLHGFESWFHGNRMAHEACISTNPLVASTSDPAVGLALSPALALKNRHFGPFIDSLRHSMRYSGAVVLRSVANYFQVYFSPCASSSKVKPSIRLPVHDLLAIIALESQRNRCLVIADQTDQLPQSMQEELQQKNIFSSQVLFQAKDEQGSWRRVSGFPANCLVSSSAPFLTTLKGFWTGHDLAVKTAEKIFADNAEREHAILTRAADRAHFLITLSHENLLPKGLTIDPAEVTEIGPDLAAAAQTFLARGAAKILLVSMADLLGTEAQGVPPALSDQQFWRLRLPLDLDSIFADQRLPDIFSSLCRERGLGVVRPSASGHNRKKRLGIRNPSSFYRLQLNKDFSFRQAEKIIPFLKGMGISHCYVSPILKARPGSPHGYDIINHGVINPEIGSREDFESFIAVLEQHQMALLLDIVPNHMGIGSDNIWWMDVLENGEISRYATFFDINWQPQQPALAGRVMLPVLGDHYGKILVSGQLELRFHDNNGSFFIHYGEQRFPVSPKSYPTILEHNLKRLAESLGKQHNGFLELGNLISSFANLPDRQQQSEEVRLANHRDKEVNKRHLARLCREQPEVKQFIEENIILFNGVIGSQRSYDLLHNLLEKQAYRLAFWRVAADEINYRRFFDINDLAGLRTEDEQVFHETHKFILDLITTGKVDGLRVDHPDGLYDPQQYFCRLQLAAIGASFDKAAVDNASSFGSEEASLYVVAEKILADFEHLPAAWPVNGTTGYDFSNLINGLLIDTSAEKAMTALYHRFIGHRFDFDDLLYTRKKLIIRTSMSGELNVLSLQLYRLAQANRSTRDFTFNRLRDGLTEVIACFPVYRTYIAGNAVDQRDVRFIDWALAKAKNRSKHLGDLSAFDFIKTVLLLEVTGQKDDTAGKLDFVLKFQQYTGPVMAKGLEDTTFYIYNRLLSLNEVGGAPKRFGISLAAFHQSNQDRLRYWPQAMLNSSTHDSKRSEDVRARINVLTEMVPEWKKRVTLWSKQNRPLKTQLDGILAPSRNDEYAFYQNLIGSWPLTPLDEKGRPEFIKRLRSTMLKASREAKVHTSWLTPNVPYEQALCQFVERSLAEANELFLSDFLSLQQDVCWFGMLNSLSQVFLKLVAPGIPDIYQGNELWRYCLVDPDNRRRVDFQKRQDLLFPMLERMENSDNLVSLQEELLTDLTDGRAKMYTIARTLQFRNTCPEIFARGSYLPLEVTGSKSQHVCAFARKSSERWILTITPRLYLGLLQGEKLLPHGERVWHDTAITLPDELVGKPLDNIFLGTAITGESSGGEAPRILVRQVLQHWPVALLIDTQQ